MPICGGGIHIIDRIMGSIIHVVDNELVLLWALRLKFLAERPLAGGTLPNYHQLTNLGSTQYIVGLKATTLNGAYSYILNINKRFI